MSGKWEVAGKTKKAGTVNNKLTKKQKKDFKLPTAENSSTENFPMANPLQEHQNIYMLMSEQLSDRDTHDTDSDNKENVATTKTKSHKSKSKKKGSPTTKTPTKNERQLVTEQLESIDCTELKKLIFDVKKRFPNHPLVWLKDLQSYFQMKLTAHESDPGLMFYERGYPHNLVSVELQTLLAGIFSDVPEHVLSTFYMECLNTFARDIRTGVTGYHSRVLLQSMSLNCPKMKNSKAIVNELQKLINDSVSRTKECVALLWCLQMTPRIKLDTQLKVWFTWMLPILQGQKTEKPVQDFIFNSIDTIINDIEESKTTQTLGTSDFFGYVDLLFAVNNPLYPHIQALMLESLDSVKTIAFSVNPEKNLRSFFPSLLIRLPSSDTVQKRLVLNYLTECLQKDPQCWLLWQQMFLKHANKSLMLLEHLHDNWGTVLKTVNRTVLKETLDRLTATLAPDNGKAKVKEVHRRAHELVVEMRHTLGSPVKAAFRLTLVVVLALLAVYILHDIKEYGSFGASRTGRMYTTVLQHNTAVHVLAMAKDCGNTLHRYGMEYAPRLLEYSSTALNSLSATAVVCGAALQTHFNYVMDNREQIVQDFYTKTEDLYAGTIGTVSNWSTAENRQWLYDTGLTYMELCGKQLAALSQYLMWLYNEIYVYIFNNFIKEPVTTERLRDWSSLVYNWTLTTCIASYEKLHSTFVG